MRDSTVGSGGGTAIPRCSAHSPTLLWELEGRNDLFSRHYDQVPAVFLLYLRLPLLRGVICHFAGRDEDQYLQIGEMRLRALWRLPEFSPAPG